MCRIMYILHVCDNITIEYDDIIVLNQQINFINN